MKNKIRQFSKGDFSLEKPDIRFSETNIIMPVGEGEIYEGSFTIENKKGGNIRGLVYPSSFRVHILEEGFEGNPVEVHYTFDGTGLLPGQIEKGNFAVVCGGGEYILDYTAIVEKPYMMTEFGKIQTLEDFKKLAMHSFGEAHRIFRGRQFHDILKYEDSRIKNLYNNMRTWALDEEALEEFLVGTKQKEKIFLTLSEESISLADVQEAQKGVLVITKNTWGFAKVDIEVKGAFLEVARSRYTTEDFVGNSLALEYVIRPGGLHGGYNYGQISVTTPYETLTVDLTVHQTGERDEMKDMQGLIAGQGLKEYLTFICGKMELRDWSAKMKKRLDQLQELDPNNDLFPLQQAHVYLRSGMKEEAGWILENGNYGRFAIGRKPEISAYYLFLMALYKNDTLQVNRSLEDLYKLYMKHPYSWPMLCMIINLDTKYRNYSDRLRVLERQFFNGANQILLYAEAYICFQEKVHLLRKLESFEIQILNFAAKYRILTKELALHTAELVCQQRKYNDKILRVMTVAYELYPEPEILTAICTQLIKGNKASREVFKWYEKAVKQELKIAQLYEFYMLSMDPSHMREEIPRIVFLYFLQGMNLDDTRVANLYENLVTYGSEDSDLYKQYREQMVQFTRAQLQRRQINNSLRVLYNHFLSPNAITLDELAALYDVCHAYSISTKKPGMKYVLVIEKDGSVRQRIAYSYKQGAKVYLYDRESRIVWEGFDGRHYVDTVPYESKRLFYEMRYVELAKNIQTEREQENGQDKVHLSMDTLKTFGMGRFDAHDIFLLCSKKAREQEEEEDDFLIYLCFELLKQGYADRATLSYLARFYCGATSNMKLVWKAGRESGVPTKALAERIITQMIFTETLFGDEEIFEDYYSGRPYFRLKQAYFAYVARQYVVSEKVISESLIRMMMQELLQQQYMADVCKIAILKYYSDKEAEPAAWNEIKEYFGEMCRKHLVFPFFLDYPQEWLREYQLYDKVFVQYEGKGEGQVRICYRLRTEAGQGEYQGISLTPLYDRLYVKDFVLYQGEELDYYFEVTDETGTYATNPGLCAKNAIDYEAGKFGRLNLISRLSAEKQYEAMLHFKQEEEIGNELFPIF